MQRLSVNQMTTYRWSFDEDVASYLRLGIGAIGVWRQKLTDFGEERGIDLLRESRLTVSNLLWAGGFTGGDLRSFRESVDDGLEAIRLAAEMQARCLVVYTGARSGHTQNHARRLLKDALKELLPAAAATGVRLGLEPMHANCGYEWTFLSEPAEALELVESLDSPQLGLVLDTYHLGFQPDWTDWIARLTHRTTVVHLADSKQPPDREQNRCRLGEGMIALPAMVAALEGAGFQGFYDLELLGEEIETSDYVELLEHSKQAFAELLP